MLGTLKRDPNFENYPHEFFTQLYKVLVEELS